MARIGIFGGSFNPPHKGHLLAAQALLQALSLDEVLLIPAGIPPHKQLADGSPDAADRLAMTEAMAANTPGLRVSDMEIHMGGACYTADTLAHLHALYPDDTLYLLVGTDMFLSLHTWSRPEQICKLAVICHVARFQDASSEEHAKQTGRLEREYGARVLCIDNQILETSSTLVRRMLRFDCAEDYLTPEVLRLIQTRGLYGTNKSLKNLPYPELCRESLALHKNGRKAHVAGCSNTAQELARLWGADQALAARAGILHDVTKALDKPAHLALCKKYNVVLRPFEVENEKLLHSKSGAAVAGGVFGECRAVTDAIFWHTTGKADMTLLEKIIYIADYMEPNRDFDGVAKLRRLAYSDLDRAMLYAFEISVTVLEERGRKVDIYSRQALDYMRQQLMEAETH